MDKGSELLTAARRGDYGKVQSLLDDGVAADHSSSEGWTALHCACEKGHDAVAKALLAAGADPRAVTAGGDTALTLAAASSSEPLLLTALLLRLPKAEYGCALHAAAAAGRLEPCRTLLAHGADVLGRDPTGRTPRQCAASDPCSALLADAESAFARGGAVADRFSQRLLQKEVGAILGPPPPSGPPPHAWLFRAVGLALAAVWAVVLLWPSRREASGG
eukprot:TRINITY_DN17347_c0_g1_i3.p1 TRINITY_DN17347_c0_g1~~TRINITY_DN17347_c0_g1_i3.p1  ORF type:complete len:234 (+),score=59.25 TRINITY_DN17347_c0_g1_i3:47-703(+)